MTDNHLPLTTFYKGWDVYQQHLVTAIAPLSAEQLALRAAPHLRSVGGNAAHIIGARAGWSYYVLERGDEHLAALANWDQADQPVHSAAELVKGLEATWQVLQDALNHWTIADLAGLVRDIEDTGEAQTYTRQWVIWHLIEHDMHHGGELSFTLGMHNLPAIDI
jgi:uncharacterized damage-inducible protein DinB